MDSEEIFVGFCMAVFVVLLFAGGFWISAESCEVKSESFDGHKYTLIGGCMVKKGDKWLPLENVRDID